jgi:uncharacterized protein
MLILFRIAIFLFVAYLLRRFIAGFAKSSPKTRTGSSAPNAANQMVKDPMCGMYMDARLAIRIDNRSEAVYFCSEECKEKYANKPTNGGIGAAVAD